MEQPVGPQVPENVQGEDEFGVAVTVNDQKDAEVHGISFMEELDATGWPRIKLAKLELVNFGKYEDAVIDFTHEGSVLPMSCLVGPNGAGKTTILEAVTMLCSNFSQYDPQRFGDMMFRRVRNWMHIQGDARMKTASFSVRGTFKMTEPAEPGKLPTDSEYVVEFTRHKFRSRHPEFIEQRLSRYCFVARFDHELNQFQMRRSRWPLFQELFSSVTGFPIEEDVDMFHDTSDSRMRKIQEEYVLGFTMRKPNEVIRQKMCSAGEKKIAKCFSTILNAPIDPSIVLVDNVLMHIEVGRHLSVMESLTRCFPNTQLVVACHSVPVSKSLPHRERLFDMRSVSVPGLVWREPWRMRLLDDVGEALERLSSIPRELCSSETHRFTSQGASLVRILETEKDGEKAIGMSLDWLSKFPSFTKADLLSTPLPKMRWHDNRQAN